MLLKKIAKVEFVRCALDLILVGFTPRLSLQCDFHYFIICYPSILCIYLLISLDILYFDRNVNKSKIFHKLETHEDN
jgi:hypothetical protein